MRVAFLGLGQMGRPMAERLLDAGHDLTVWNRTRTKAQPLLDRGARAALSPSDAVTGAAVAITMLADPAALEDVLFGEGGAAGSLSGTLIEMSTVGPTVVRDVTERLAPTVEVLDAPVLGSVPQANAGRLKIFVGGSEADVARWRALLGAMGSVHHVGPSGAGAAMKLVVNSTIGALAAAFGEAMRLADLLGLDERAALDVLEDSMLGPIVSGKRERVESGSYPPNFKVSLAAKDLGLVVSHGQGELRIAEETLRALEAASEAGLGDLDYSAIVAHLRGREAKP